ncbi:MAG: ATP-dependent zinc metalloprotease FtsH [Patescibacteria group bacterium]|nr:ATP-dependent zinc metalloprotease FtsH [Patescibacteria group bacterium]
MEKEKSGLVIKLMSWKTMIILVVAMALVIAPPCWYYWDYLNRITINYSQAIEMVEQNKVVSVSITKNEVYGRYTDDKLFRTRIPDNSDYINVLRENGVNISIEPEPNNMFSYAIIIIIVLVIMCSFGYLTSKRIGQQLEKTLNKNPNEKYEEFGKSRARLLEDGDKRTTFADVGGAKGAKEELKEIIGFLKNPKKYERLGGRIPKGILLTGPPGTGKTLLARAVAGEADVPFFSISGSDFTEMLVGVGAARVRDLWKVGRKNAPCIIFMDEIDAVGTQRGTGFGGGNDEQKQTLNQLLVEMDGMKENPGVIFMAATNRPDVLDPALLRPGRFDLRIVVDRPHVAGREEILKIFIEKIKIDSSINLTEIALSIPGFVGADIENLVNEAARKATREDKDWVEFEDFNEAEKRVIMGPERRALKLSEREKRLITLHELGHAIVGVILAHSDTVKEVTNIPRAKALGHTKNVQEEERYLETPEFAIAKIITLFAGRAAEEIFAKTKTSGAGNDIECATDIAKKMVMRWGMSKNIGPIALGTREQDPFLGRRMALADDIGPALLDEAGKEYQNILHRAYKKARELLERNKEVMKVLEPKLFEEETITGEVVTDACEKYGKDKPNSVESE